MNATIYALASGVGRAAIAVVRVSGPEAAASLARLCGRRPVPRAATLATLRDPASGDMLDRALVLFFPAPASFTGEDCVELHLHGGPAVAAGVLRALAGFGLRPAEPGEFTRRAFMAGKLDLAEVEGLADLIDAETEQQRRQAMRQFGGGMAATTAGWRAALLEAASLVEAEIDFSDEGDVGALGTARIDAIVAPVATDLLRLLAQGDAGERLRRGLTVVIAGPPNAGKSSLLNALARREAAIVSDVPGTTRDAIEVHFDLDGYPLTLVDTAGLRDSADVVEQLGVARSRGHADAADLVLWCSPVDAPMAPDAALDPHRLRVVATKADLRTIPGDALAVSASTGDGLDRLRAALAGFASESLAGAADTLITRERHRRALQTAVLALERLRADLSAPLEVLAEELRLATRALENLAGRVDVEDVLGEIFGRFCIGK